MHNELAEPKETHFDTYISVKTKLSKILMCERMTTSLGAYFFFGLCLTSELCSTGTVADWTRNSQTPREVDFGSD